MADRHAHWEQVWRTRAPREVSWYQPEPTVSLELIEAAGIAQDSGIIDVGGGASLLVDRLLDRGYSNLAVLDIAGGAMQTSRDRLGARASGVEWHEADVTSFEPPRRYGLWHDRAVFHFLTQAADRRAYVATLRKALKPDGAVVIAAFAPDGPPKCSGLDVMRHDEKSLATELGEDFAIREVRRETHRTPGGAEQRFIYCRFQILHCQKGV
ncbi:MAG TPA: class I SAM-dependent methyltransferase [Steroidobacteraceae bacterium]|nr:class I SAM-dependent methyltransferase [Steroidobacteraceae bacterium]